MQRWWLLLCLMALCLSAHSKCFHNADFTRTVFDKGKVDQRPKSFFVAQITATDYLNCTNHELCYARKKLLKYIDHITDGIRNIYGYGALKEQEWIIVPRVTMARTSISAIDDELARKYHQCEVSYRITSPRSKVNCEKNLLRQLNPPAMKVVSGHTWCKRHLDN